MVIKFIKRKEGDHTISCERSDRTVTWMRSTEFFVVHDLCHFAVETFMKFKHAFYGMLAAGTNITDFSLPKEKRTFELTEEAFLAEHLVNLLFIEHRQGKLDDLILEFNSTYPGKMNDKINEANVGQMRKEFQNLTRQWNELAEGGSISLEFEE